MITAAAFVQWLDAYGAAWEARDAEAFAALFARDAQHWWTPFEAPKTGRAEIADAFAAAVARQRGPQFTARVIAADADGGWAKWSCSFIRAGTDAPARVDGVLHAVFEGGDLCTEFREWRHTLQPEARELAEAADA